MTDAEKLPLWRAIAGFGVLCGLLLVALGLAPVYVANYRLSQYVRGLAAQPDTMAAPDDILRAKIVDKAHGLRLPVQAGDVTVHHAGSRVQLQIARYKVQVWHADLHFPGINTR